MDQASHERLLKRLKTRHFGFQVYNFDQDGTNWSFMPPRLKFYFLGSPKIEMDDRPIVLDRRKALALLAYLSIERGPHQRAHLSSLLWPDIEQSKAFKNLRQTLWGIQRALGEKWLEADYEILGIKDEADIWLDAEKFNSLAEKSRLEADPSLRTALLAESAALYRNHFLTGFSLKDAHPFNDWLFSVSEELKQNYSHILTSLSTDYCSLGQADQAIPFARRLVALDPLNEAAQRQLMEVYVQAGQQNAALQQYQSFEQILRQELNLDPQPETRDLYRKIRKGELKQSQPQQKDGPLSKMHNLSYPLSKFIGREKELKEIKSLLQSHQLITLAGAGGLARQAFHQGWGIL